MARRSPQLAAAALAAALIATAATAAPASASGTSGPTGGAGFGGLAPTYIRQSVPAPPSRHDRGTWLSSFRITEYWPAPESWFVGAFVSVPGLRAKHRIDWLYSANGVSMEGEGIGLDGQSYHIEAVGSGGWVTAAGRSTSPTDGWSAGAPYWRAGGYWRNRTGAVTFPLSAGGWTSGSSRRYIALRGVSFAPGLSLPLHFWQSIAVDPSVIPLGSRVYIPAYRHDGYGGWFIAQDTGGAIRARHVDVYRRPPTLPGSAGQHLTGQRVYVIKPH